MPGVLKALSAAECCRVFESSGAFLDRADLDREASVVTAAHAGAATDLTAASMRSSMHIIPTAFRSNSLAISLSMLS